MFIDPPYAESRQFAAYNVTFDEHDHIRLAKILKETKFKFLLTYDDCEFIRNLYSWCHQFDRTWTYSVANSKVHHNPRESGNELFISNFKPDHFKK
jgi:DNA adenine methylase